MIAMDLFWGGLNLLDPPHKCTHELVLRLTFFFVLYVATFYVHLAIYTVLLFNVAAFIALKGTTLEVVFDKTPYGF